MSKTFIDCGYYRGRALDYYAPLMDENWKVYAFEPNPDLECDFSRFPFEVELIRKAIWIEDGTRLFVKSARDDASYLATRPIIGDDVSPVECIDFSRFVSELEGTIVVSMDIEGSEFEVLRKMLEDGTAEKLSILDIEFHHRLLPEESAGSASELRQAFEGKGILVKLKLEL